ncbi:hypothetical protein [Nocardioides yefusunii]|uniref:Htaa domain-containing protein n=1 Tax=Nocardioides yefusunii TaxID=2500546 RepID=A0ABW1R1B5_9ACTN|nr:hypothetical protein [Nocardioides yefusunii]
MQHRSLNTRPGRRVALSGALGLAAASVVMAAPAQAAGNVTVDADGKGAVMDSTYSTTLTVSGKGFQSLKGGHGGVYVWFGTVNGKWKPSQGGKSGVNYVYVPDEETKDNAGFQRYVAFPGSNTAAAANGGTMDKNGNWSTKIVVPGPKFQAVGRNGSATTVDCRKVTCGVITIGAHGVKNASNETFTPVKLTDLARGNEPQAPAGTAQTPGTAPTAAPTTAPSVAPSSGTAPETAADTGKKGKDESAPTGSVQPALTVDHAAAVSGRAMSFTGTNLVPGEQFTVVLDDGAAAVGPFVAGADGRASGVIQIPAETAGGTHQLRLFGASADATVKFGVQRTDAGTPAAAEEEKNFFTAANIFAGAAGLLFVGAVVFTLFRLRGGRRAQNS